MKTIHVKTEWIIWLIVIAPITVVVWFWGQIPDVIPSHFNLEGQADQWREKSLLLWMVPTITIGLYALFLVIPLIDPKQRMLEMGNKYFALRLIIHGFITATLLVWLQSAISNTKMDISLFFPLIAIFFILLGIYLQSVKPNYFIGIRTPWTLQDEDNWRSTHRLASRLYIAGGILMLLTMVFDLHRQYFMAVFIAVITLAVIPFFYSLFYYFRKKS